MSAVAHPKHDIRASHQEQTDHGQPEVGFAQYLRTGHFMEASAENWESEFLQMAAFVLLTTVFYHRGSAESRRPGVIEPVDVDPRHFSSSPGVP